MLWFTVLAVPAPTSSHKAGYATPAVSKEIEAFL